MIADNISAIRARVSRACGRAGRSPDSVTILCVSKGRAIEEIRQAVAAGLPDIAENRVQEAQRKFGALSGVRWHFIGHLQTNKAGDAVGMFELIHSVDSARLADAIDGKALKRGKVQDICVEVNVSGERTKQGIAPGECRALVDHIDGLGHLRLRGLMTMAPWSENPEAARPYFRALRGLLEELNAARAGERTLDILSMGMSADFEVAVEEGATMIRPGRAIFEDTL